jgi:putative membrane protein
MRETLMLRLTLAALHLLALGIGLGGLWGRARALSQRPLDLAAVRRAFVADSWWGIAALLWLTTGLWRLFAGTEKATSYYLHNHIFFAKMAFFITIGLLEIWPMATLIRWRRAVRRERDAWRPDVTLAARISAISYVETALLLAIVVAAVSMARGYGYQVS